MSTPTTKWVPPCHCLPSAGCFQVFHPRRPQGEHADLGLDPVVRVPDEERQSCLLHMDGLRVTGLVQVEAHQERTAVLVFLELIVARFAAQAPVGFLAVDQHVLNQALALDDARGGGGVEVRARRDARRRPWHSSRRDCGGVVRRRRRLGNFRTRRGGTGPRRHQDGEQAHGAGRQARREAGHQALLASVGVAALGAAQQLGECGRHLARLLVALLRLLDQHPGEDRRQLPRHVGPQALDGRRLRLVVLHQLLGQAAAAERRLPRQQEVRHAAQAVDVGADIGAVKVDRLLRGHVNGRSENRAGLRMRVVGVGSLGEAEIGDFGSAVGEQEDVGGTVGDLESGPYLEAIRQFKQKNWNDVLIMLVAPILWIPTIKEFKTKPLQNSVKEMQSFGLQPDILLCRIDREMPTKMLDKISHLTNVPREAVFDAPDVKTIYQVPIEFYNRHIDDLIADKFHLKRNGCRIHKYRELVEKYVDHADMPVVNIAIVGKYDNCDEAYLSLKEAVYHAAVEHEVKAEIKWINAKELDQAKDMRGVWKYFEDIDGVIVPGGFDSSGVEGKIRAIKYVREKKIPFLGICLGLQCSVIEIARNVCHLEGANSVEFDKDTKHPVIHFVEGQEKIRKKSGTMRLGAYDCELVKGSIIHELYKKGSISERHRHRYEVNGDYVAQLDKVQFVVSGVNPDTKLIEMMELDRAIHPFFVATQAHPEFKSRLGSPAPLFDGLIQAAIKSKAEKALSNTT